MKHSAGAGIFQEIYVNFMAANILGPDVATPGAAMAFTMEDQRDPSVGKGFKYCEKII